ncbi:MAG: peptide chain release factor aRF-1 [Candidatus Hodarchaeota archaeon]
MSYRKYKYAKELSDLQKKESPDGSTCLISLYVPPNRSISDFVQELSDEMGTATNIRSKFTQKNVISALKNVIGKLKLYGNKSPDSGIAIFSGVTADSGYKDHKLESYVFEPIQPISRKMYVCDNRFHVEHLLDRLEEKDVFALLAIDSAKATIGILKGDSVNIVKSTRSGAAKKHRKGGQSSVRFARLREEAIDWYLKRVADDMKQIFIENATFDLKGVIIGGPGQIKDQIVKHFDNRLNKNVFLKDLGYGGDQSGIHELVAASDEVLKGVAIMEEKQLVHQFEQAIMEGKAEYGEKQVREKLLIGAVSILLLSGGIDSIRVEVKCNICGYTIEKTLKSNEVENYIANQQKNQCPKCKTVNWEVNQRDLVLELGDLAEKTSTRVEIINSQTEEGRKIQSFGGVCGILRYKIS